MKKYKTWEVLKAIQENPNLKFKIGNGFTANKDGCEGLGFTLIANKCLMFEYEWELVQEPVDFMEAVKAYSEGKTIRVEHSGDTYIYKSRHTHDELGSMLCSECNDPIRVKEILEGSWYVEDSHE